MSADVFNFRAYTRLKQLQHLLRTQQIDQDFYWSLSEVPATQAGSAVEA
jgi:hypothetical protein